MKRAGQKMQTIHFYPKLFRIVADTNGQGRVRAIHGEDTLRVANVLLHKDKTGYFRIPNAIMDYIGAENHDGRKIAIGGFVRRLGDKKSPTKYGLNLMKRLPNRLKVKAAKDPQTKKSYRMSNLDEQVELTEKEIKAIDE